MTSSIGNVSFPLDPALIDYSARTVADPAQINLANFIKQVAAVDLGAAFDKAKVGTSVTGAIVEDVVPYDPERFVAMAAVNKFPLLAVYRDKSKVARHSLQKMCRTQRWGIIYILPELDTAAMGKLYSLTTAFSSAIGQAIFNQSHVGALDGYNMLDICGFSRADIVETDDNMYLTGAIPGQADSMVVYPACKLILETDEIGTEFLPVVGLEGIDVDIKLRDVETDTEIDHFIDLDIETQ